MDACGRAHPSFGMTPTFGSANIIDYILEKLVSYRRKDHREFICRYYHEQRPSRSVHAQWDILTVIFVINAPVRSQGARGRVYMCLFVSKAWKHGENTFPAWKHGENTFPAAFLVNMLHGSPVSFIWLSVTNAAALTNVFTFFFVIWAVCFSITQDHSSWNSMVNIFLFLAIIHVYGDGNKNIQ